MRVAVIGANGQLGRELVKALPTIDVVGLGHDEVMVEDLGSVERALEPLTPDVVINCASYTNVEASEDKAEDAFRVNTLGAKNVAAVCNDLGARVVYLSSDYVFGGDASRKTPLNEFDEPRPINVLGRSKVAGEQSTKHVCPRHVIVRTSAVFGRGGSRAKGGNFVDKMISRALQKGHVQVVDDQVMSPTSASDLAAKIVELIRSNHLGTFHITNSGSCSWYSFTRELFRQAGIEASCQPVTSDSFPSIAKRPSYSVLDNFHLRLVGIRPMRRWQDALRDYLDASCSS